MIARPRRDRRAAGVLLESRLGAVVTGPALHLLGDRMFHHNIPSRRFELWTGTSALALVALRHGPLGAATLGAVAASVPDAEPVPGLPRRGASCSRATG